MGKQCAVLAASGEAGLAISVVNRVDHLPGVAWAVEDQDHEL